MDNNNNPEDINDIEGALFNEIDRLKKAGASFSQLTEKLNGIVASQKVIVDNNKSISNDIDVLLSRIDENLVPIERAVDSLNKLSRDFQESITQISPTIEQMLKPVEQNVVLVRELVKNAELSFQGLISTKLLDSERRQNDNLSKEIEKLHLQGESISTSVESTASIVSLARQEIGQKLIETSYQIADANNSLLVAFGNLGNTLDQIAKNSQKSIEQQILGISRQISGANSNLAVSLSKLEILCQGVSEQLNVLDGKWDKRLVDIANDTKADLAGKAESLSNQLTNTGSAVLDLIVRNQSDASAKNQLLLEKISFLESQLTEVSKSSKLTKLLILIASLQVLLILVVLFMK